MHQKLILSVLTFFLFTATAYSQTENVKYLTDDFFVVVNSEASSKRLRPLDCRANIEKVICLVDPSQAGQDPLQRKCQEGGSAYTKYFHALYDQYPPIFQKMFCSLDKLFIEKEFFGTAYAGVITDGDGKHIGAQLGIRKSVLDEKLNLTTWASWKEQLSFGGVKDDYTVSKNLPTIETSSKIEGVSDFLYFVIAHEFGHIFDFANQINSTVDCPDQQSVDCDMSPHSFGAITWETDRRPKLNNDFVHRSFLCFYWCEGNTIDESHTSQIYSDLNDTDFISIYATTQPWDDFADSLAYYVMDQYLDTKYVIHTNKGSSYNIIKKLHSVKFREKYDYLEQFVAREDLVYPGHPR